MTLAERKKEMRRLLVIVMLTSMTLLVAPVHALDSEKPSAGLISITLDDVEMVDVLRMFSRIAGTNFRYDPKDFQALRVTVNLNDEPWLPALQSLLASHGFVLVAEPGSHNILSIVKADKPETAVRIQYASAAVTLADTVLEDIRSNNIASATASLQAFADNNRQTIKAFEISQKTAQNGSGMRLASDSPPLMGMAEWLSDRPHGPTSHGITLALSSEKPAYEINSEMNAWSVLSNTNKDASGRTIPYDPAIHKDDYLIITDEDGKETKINFTYIPGQFAGFDFRRDISAQLHSSIRRPGTYKLQSKIGAMESNVIEIKVVPAKSETQGKAQP
jgi:hypothetical protein